MTRLDRVLDLLESYDRLSATVLENYHNAFISKCFLPSFLLILEKRKPNSPKNLSSMVVGGRTNEI